MVGYENTCNILNTTTRYYNIQCMGCISKSQSKQIVIIKTKQRKQESLTRSETKEEKGILLSNLIVEENRKAKVYTGNLFQFFSLFCLFCRHFFSPLHAKNVFDECQIDSHSWK